MISENQPVGQINWDKGPVIFHSVSARKRPLRCMTRQYLLRLQNRTSAQDERMSAVGSKKRHGGVVAPHPLYLPKRTIRGLQQAQTNPPCQNAAIRPVAIHSTNGTTMLFAAVSPDVCGKSCPRRCKRGFVGPSTRPLEALTAVGMRDHTAPPGHARGHRSHWVSCTVDTLVANEQALWCAPCADRGRAAIGADVWPRALPRGGSRLDD